MAVKIVIEPVFEADFQDNSYGFRPKRSAHQAVDDVKAHLLQGKMDVIDADISKYFPAAGDSLETQVDRFMVAQAIILSLAGVPGIYFHSLFGSRNDREAALQTGINRRINRQKLTLAELEADLADKGSLRACVFERYHVLHKARRSHPAFNPHAEQRILEGGSRIFAVMRTAGSARAWVLCLHNVTNEPVSLCIATMGVASTEVWTEMLGETAAHVPAVGTRSINFRPYEVKWLAGGSALPSRPEAGRSSVARDGWRGSTGCCPSSTPQMPCSGH